MVSGRAATGIFTRVLLIGLGGKIVLEPRPLIEDSAKITMTGSSKALTSSLHACVMLGR